MEPSANLLMEESSITLFVISFLLFSPGCLKTLVITN